MSEHINEQLGESLSALVDGEADELDLQRVLQNSDNDALRVSWHRYHMTSYSLQPGQEAQILATDLSQRIMSALDEEPGVSAHIPARWHRFLQPAASFAVAASVFAAVLVGSQFYTLLGDGSATSSLDVADRVSPIGLVNGVGGAAVQAGFARPVTRTSNAAAADYDQLARKRLNRYMLLHTQEAALNAPQGMMPYAKVVSFTTEE